MKVWIAARLLVASSVLFVGCGGSVVTERDAGGAGGTPASGGAGQGGNPSQGGSSSLAGNSGVAGGGAGGAPASCNGAEAGRALPLRFLLQSTTPVFVKQVCTIEYRLTRSCTGPAPLVHDTFCTPDCLAPNPSCVSCGACYSGALAVGPGQSQQIEWSALLYSYSKLPGGCSCSVATPAPLDEYTLSIDVYLSAEDAEQSRNAFPHQVSFRLPVPNGVVTVDLGFIGL